jgi:hypothetical protein
VATTGALIALMTHMANGRKDITPDEIRRVIERVDGQLREAERLRSYVNERSRRQAFFPDRRKAPRLPESLDDSSRPPR